MKTRVITLLSAIFIAVANVGLSQSNNPTSIYEGENIEQIKFIFSNLPADQVVATNITQKIENSFKIYPQSHYNSFMIDYYLSQINIMGFVERATLEVNSQSANSVQLVVSVELSTDITKMTKSANIFKNISSFPSIYVSQRTFITMKAAASQMVYSNKNAWFADAKSLTTGNPLATDPLGADYSAWMEGFASAGIYGITKIIPSINLHLYGGASYIASYSLGDELFTSSPRFAGAVEDAFAGFIGGGRTKRGDNYRYNALYGRKQFILADGFLLINTAMNGSDRAALQLNPRWAAKSLFQAGFSINNLTLGIFRLKPNELPILNSNTTINGVNLELGNKDMFVIGATFLQVPKSTLRYYLPDGTTRSREGMQVYNLRLYKSPSPIKGGLFFKTEGAYERNPNFDMGSYAFYAEGGWKFQQVKTVPTISYRFAYFSGDDPNTTKYERWDALYTGGNGEQWVQGSNMYKIVQNSNEMSHRIQFTLNPIRKIQVVTQLWSFIAPQKNNLGGNPALSTLQSRYYGSEINLTIKYFRSRSWYFHLNTAYTIPSNAIKELTNNPKDWFCLSAFARYSF